MGEVFSEVKQQEMGVPQGSVLSVMLFNIKIINIVKNMNSRTNCSLYVDDFLICYRARNINHIERQLQICLDPIYPTPPLGQDMTQGQFLKRSLALISFTNGPLRMD